MNHKKFKNNSHYLRLSKNHNKNNINQKQILLINQLIKNLLKKESEFHNLSNFFNDFINFFQFLILIKL